MGYLCVYGLYDDPNVTKFDYAKDWIQKLDDMNSNFIDDRFYCCCLYEVESESAVNSLMEKAFDIIGPRSRKYPGKNFYDITPENAIEVIRGIAGVSGTRDNMHKKDYIDDQLRNCKQIKQNLAAGPIELQIKNYLYSFSRMTESTAQLIFNDLGRPHGISVCYPLTYEKSYGFGGYYVNFDVDRLNKNQSIIIYDVSKKVLFLFNIPAYALKVSDFEYCVDDHVKLKLDNNGFSFQDLYKSTNPIELGKYLVAYVYF